MPRPLSQEAAAAHWAGDERVGRFVRPELHRSARLRADLEHLTGCTDLPVTAAAVAYAARLERVARTSAAGFRRPPLHALPR